MTRRHPSSAMDRRPTKTFTLIKGGKMKCLHCPLLFSSKKEVLVHAVVNKCDFCGKKVSCRTHLKKHVRNNCIKMLSVSEKQKGATDVKKQKVQCDKCKKIFISLTARQIHQVFKCNDDVKNKFSCDHCKKSFVRNQIMQLHKKSRECPKCKNCFACSTLFKMHLTKCEQKIIVLRRKSTPKQDRDKTCEYCKATFNSHDFHFGNARVCKHCNLQSQCANLNVDHEINCTANLRRTKKYKCKTCNKLLTDSRSLNNHQKLRICNFKGCRVKSFCYAEYLVHFESEERKFYKDYDIIKLERMGKREGNKRQCETCSQWLSSLGKLKYHQRSRICTICELETFCCKEFSKHVDFEENKAKQSRVVELNKQNRCSTCKEDFATSDYLQVHQQFRECTECNFKFNCYKEFCDHQHEQAKSVLKSLPENKGVKIDITTLSNKCPFCGDFSKAHGALEWHVCPTRCPRCTYFQPCTTLLAKHLKVCKFSENRKTFFCPRCDQSFSTAALLGMHVQFKCESKIKNL